MKLYFSCSTLDRVILQKAINHTQSTREDEIVHSSIESGEETADWMKKTSQIISECENSVIVLGRHWGGLQTYETSEILRQKIPRLAIVLPTMSRWPHYKPFAAGYITWFMLNNKFLDIFFGPEERNFYCESEEILDDKNKSNQLISVHPETPVLR